MSVRNLCISAAALLVLPCLANAQNNNFFGGGVGLFNPIIDTVSTGTRTVLQPTVSADRKYVTISGQLENSQLLALQNFPFFAINPNAGGIVGGVVQLPGVGNVNVGGQVNAPGATPMELDGPARIQRGAGGKILMQSGMTRIASK